MRATKDARQYYPSLAAWRDANGFTQREAADFLGISQMKYCRWERRTRFAKGPEAKIVRRKTCVPVEVLVGAA